MKEIIEHYNKINRKEQKLDLSDLIEDIKIYITWLIWSPNEIEYDWLLNFKREVLEIDPIKYFSNINQSIDILNYNQKKLVIWYREELSLSAIYGTPLNETKKEKDLLIVWENLNIIVIKVNNILKMIKK